MKNVVRIDPTDIVLDSIEQEQLTGSSDIKYDSFYDGASSGSWRTSSDHDPSKYYDPSTAFRESDGRSLASLLPSRGGLQGVIIPKSKRFGGSLGWNSHAPQVINIDPHIAGQSSVVDLADVSKEKMERAMASVANIQDPKLAASLAFRKIASGTKPVGLPETVERVTNQGNSHMLARGAYVTPKAGMNGAQISRNTPKPIPVKGNTTKMDDKEIEEMDRQAFEAAVSNRIGNESKPESRSTLFNKPKSAFKVAMPETSEMVTYEVEGFGHLTCSYTSVIRDGINLILVCDNNQKNTQKFFPEPNDEKQFIVDVHSDPNVYKVISPGIKFTLFNFDICVLFIVEEQSKED